jgi:hypothetical protein
MNESGNSTIAPPRTAAELLDREEALAIQRITNTLGSVGEDLCAATALRPAIRGHPLLAVGLGAVAGFFGGPVLLKASRRLVGGVPSMLGAVSNPTKHLKGIALASLRAVRARG